MKTLWLRKAENVDHQLRMIRRMLLSSFDTDKSRADLTLPQTRVMVILATAFQDGELG